MSALELDGRGSRFAVAGSSSILSFVASLLTISEFLGGGLQGIGMSAILAGTVGATINLIWPRPTGNAFQKSGWRDHCTSVCHQGPHGVVPRNFTKLPLDVREGDIVSGYLTETDNYNFSWGIVDEGKYVQLLKHRRSKPVQGEDDVPAAKVEWTVPHGGPWFLVLHIPGKRLAREVEVHLRRL